jgi:hypothetical protein
MASWVITTHRNLTQQIVKPVAQLTKKNAKFGAVWNTNALGTWLSSGDNRMERSARSFGDATCVSHACVSDCRAAVINQKGGTDAVQSEQA